MAGIFRGLGERWGWEKKTNTTLTSAGSDDVFVAQYDSSGLLQWAKRVAELEWGTVEQLLWMVYREMSMWLEYCVWGWEKQPDDICRKR